MALLRWRWNVACGIARVEYQVLQSWPKPLRLSFWWEPSIWVVLVVVAAVAAGGFGMLTTFGVALEVVHLAQGVTKPAWPWRPAETSVSVASAAVGALLLCLGAYALLSRVYAGALARHYWDTELPIEAEFPEKAASLAHPPEQPWIRAVVRLGVAACIAGTALTAWGLVELIVRR